MVYLKEGGMARAHGAVAVVSLVAAMVIGGCATHPETTQPSAAAATYG